jgi:hypothetical protein
MTPKLPYGPWSVYRRKSDAQLWVDFHAITSRLSMPIATALAQAARMWVDSNKEWNSRLKK